MSLCPEISGSVVRGKPLNVAADLKSTNLTDKRRTTQNYIFLI